MSEQAVALGGGILFLLVAVVGGGFTMREVVIPEVPRWARGAAALIGLTLVILAFVPVFGTTVDGEQRAVRAAATTPDEELRTGLDIDTRPATSPDGLRLTNLRADPTNMPPRVGDTVRMSFTLTNASEVLIALESTFVAARDPAGVNRDTGHSRPQGLAPGDSVDAAGSVLLDRNGAWSVWPCYAVDGEDASCPDMWRVTHFLVR